MKVTAIDGEVIDYVTKDIDFVKTETDNTAIINILSGVGGNSNCRPSRILRYQKKRLIDLDLIDSCESLWK